MKVVRDERFDRERKEFAFRGCCEDCVLFLADEQSCAHNYPNWEHRRAYLDAPAEGQDVVFCKEFELG